MKTPGTNLGDSVTASFRLSEGQAISFILRDAEDSSPDQIDTDLVDKLQMDTVKYWNRWISGSKYNGRWDEVVSRSLFILKMLIFEPTGAIVAAPTFSLPEDFGGTYTVGFSCCGRIRMQQMLIPGLLRALETFNSSPGTIRCRESTWQPFAYEPWTESHPTVPLKSEDCTLAFDYFRRHESKH